MPAGGQSAQDLWPEHLAQKLQACSAKQTQCPVKSMHNSGELHSQFPLWYLPFAQCNLPDTATAKSMRFWKRQLLVQSIEIRYRLRDILEVNLRVWEPRIPRAVGFIVQRQKT